MSVEKVSDFKEGLPVAGYRPQGAEALVAVNFMKVQEELLLRQLELWAKDEKLSVDARWLSVGKTHLEQAFMAINRAIFKPERLDDEALAQRAISAIEAA